MPVMYPGTYQAHQDLSQQLQTFIQNKIISSVVGNTKATVDKHSNIVDLFSRLNMLVRSSLIFDAPVIERMKDIRTDLNGSLGALAANDRDVALQMIELLSTPILLKQSSPSIYIKSWKLRLVIVLN